MEYVMRLRPKKTLRIDRTEKDVLVIADGEVVLSHGYRDVKRIITSISEPTTWGQATKLGLRMLLLGDPEFSWDSDRRGVMQVISELYTGDPWSDLEELVVAKTLNLMAEAGEKNSIIASRIKNEENMVDLQYLNDLCRKRVEILAVMHLLKVHLKETDPDFDFDTEGSVMLYHLRNCDDYIYRFVRSLSGEFGLEADLEVLVQLISVYTPIHWFTSELLYWAYGASAGKLLSRSFSMYNHV